MVGSILSVVHVYSVVEQMRGVPINTLNPQRTALIVANFLKTGKVPSPPDLRFQEDLMFPERPIQDAGNVKVGRALHKAVKPSEVQRLKQVFVEEKFLLSHGKSWTDMVLEHDATGEDALRGWLVAAYVKSMTKIYNDPDDIILQDAYDKMNDVFNPFLSQVQAKGWYTDRFLDGTGTRFAW